MNGIIYGLSQNGEILNLQEFLKAKGLSSFLAQLNSNSTPKSPVCVPKGLCDKVKFTEISCNGLAVHGITSFDDELKIGNGELYAWGTDPCQFGVLGLGERSQSLSPYKMNFSSETKFISCSTGNKHSSAITGQLKNNLENRDLYFWGTSHSNEFGTDEPKKFITPFCTLQESDFCEIYVNGKCSALIES